MEKLKMHSPDFVNENIAKLAELFPNCVTEVEDLTTKNTKYTNEKKKYKKSIDFDLLRQELSGSIVEGPQERYHLDWPGKKEALLTANAPIAKTLRPCREESVDFDTTENLFIEGDNLDALKLLQETYLGKVKMIYIDPPYNTGNDFIYEDDFTENSHEFLMRSNQKDEEGNRLVANTESNGRFHSDWLSMIYSRLKLARNLLKDDGVIFISIDDNELCNIDKICREVFGEKNKIGIISRATGTRMGTGSRGIARELDYIVVYSKTNLCSLYKLPMNQEELVIYNEEDERGKYLTRSLRRTGGENRREDRPTMFYPVFSPDGDEVYPIAPEGWESRWICGKETYEELLKEGLIVWKKVNKNGELIWQVYQKHYMSDGRESSDLWDSIDGNKKATKEVNAIFDNKKVFDHPKPIGVMQKVIQLGTKQDTNVLVIDFFAGSSATAHAIMQLNAEDGGNRKFIMVQLSEACDENSEAYRAGYKTIAEIAKERIRRAGKKILEELTTKDTKNTKEENGLLFQKKEQENVRDFRVFRGSKDLDIGFRVFKIDTSNMADVYYTPDTINQDQMSFLTENIKPDRTSEDLLFQVLLDWGVPITMPVSKEEISGKEVFFVDNNALAACFETGSITEEFCKELAVRKPLRVVFRDSGFKDDSVKINVEQIFKLMSPHTEVRSI